MKVIDWARKIDKNIDLRALSAMLTREKCKKNKLFAPNLLHISIIFCIFASVFSSRRGAHDVNNKMFAVDGELP